ASHRAGSLCLWPVPGLCSAASVRQAHAPGYGCRAEGQAGFGSYPFPKWSHRCDVFTMSPTILTLPARMPIGDLKRFFLAGLTTATGRPRLVTVIVSPLDSSSSIKPRHFALNSVADTYRVPMSPLYQQLVR